MLPKGHFNGKIQKLISIPMRLASANTLPTKKPIYGQTLPHRIANTKMEDSRPKGRQIKAERQ